MGSAEAEIFECERYRVMAGWSSSYLLPTDRGAYRTRGTKTSWSKLSEAEKAVLGPGWQWEDLHDGDATSSSTRWQVARLDQSDEEGWTYGSQFTSSFEGSPTAGMTSIARWRRLVRSQIFVGGVQFLRAVGAPVPVCLNIDLEVASVAGRHILEGIAAASLKTSWSTPALVSLKQKLLAFLLKQPAGCSSLVRTVQGAMKDFVAAQGGMMAQVGAVLKGTDEAALSERIKQVEACFPHFEREAYAAAALRRLCPDCCCSSPQEKHECRYAPMVCPNEGCGARISAYAAAAHDEVCKFKPVRCPRCSELVRRGELQSHLAAACPEREAVCPFASLGCSAAIVARELHVHMEECVQSHLLLTLQTLQEERQLSSQLAARVAELEQKAATSEASVAPLAALVARLEATEKKLAQDEKKSEADAKKSDAAIDALQKDLAAVKKLAQDQSRLSPVVEQQGKQLAANTDRLANIDSSLQALGVGRRS